MKTEIKNKALTLYFSGEIDHHTAKEMRETADGEITFHAPKEVILDFSGVSFMDSSGVGLIMGRYKLSKSLGAYLSVQGLSKRDQRIVAMSGLSKLIEIRD